MLYRFAAVEVESDQPVTGWAVFRTQTRDEALPLMTIQETYEPMELNGEPAARHAALEVWPAADGRVLILPGYERICRVGVAGDGMSIRVWTAPASLPHITGPAVEHLLQTAVECASIRLGVQSLHSAAVALDGFGVAFTGNSGVGKSTRAQQWVRSLGADLISGDRPQLSWGQEGAWLHGVPWDGKEQCFCNRTVPLKAVLDVRRGDTVRIRRMTTKQKRAVLMRQCFIPMWDESIASRQMGMLMQLARQIPMYRVFCGPDAESARRVRRILYEHPEEIMEEREDMKAAKGFILRNVVGEYLLMPTGENIGKYDGTVVLNAVSAFVWEKLQEPVSRDDLLQAVLDEFEVDEARASTDLDALLQKLRSLGVLQDE